MFTVVAGDFAIGSAAAWQPGSAGRWTELILQTSSGLNVVYTPPQLAALEIVNESSLVTVLSRWGWGDGAEAAAGPIAIASGLIPGAQRSTLVVALVFADGRKALLSGDPGNSGMLASFGSSLLAKAATPALPPQITPQPATPNLASPAIAPAAVSQYSGPHASAPAVIRPTPLATPARSGATTWFLRALAILIVCVVVGPLAFAILSSASYAATLVAAGVCAVLGVVVLAHPLPFSVLRHRWVGGPLLWLALFGGVTGFASKASQEESIRQKVELEELRKSKPDEFLARILKEKGEKAWLVEFQRMKPDEFRRHQAQKAADEAEQQRRKAEEAARLQAQADAELLALRKTNPDEYLKQLKAKDETKWAAEFKALRPGEYAKYEAERAAEAKREAAAAERRAQIAAPLDYLTLDFAWRKDGFGAVMVGDFTVKSRLVFSVKDIVVACVGSTNSGTDIDFTVRTLYEIVPAKGTKVIREINMGFVPQQVTRAGCRIKSVVPIY